MNVWQSMVRSFHVHVVGGPTSPARPEIRDADLRARLILEEALETAVGLVGDHRASPLLAEVAQKVLGRPGGIPVKSPDIVEVVDGLCDLLYVLLGTAEAVGVDLDHYFRVVHDANMKKTCAPTADGVPGKKGAKPPGWVDPKGKIRELLDGERQYCDALDEIRAGLEESMKRGG